MAIKILDIGQCGLDGPRMKRLWESKLGATVTRVDTAEEAAGQLKEHDFNLVLVNRVLAATGDSGIDTIRELRAAGNTLPIALVSDREDAQQEAVEAGAQHGFGKADLQEQATIDLVKTLASSGQED